jgi:hypothetical protein
MCALEAQVETTGDVMAKRIVINVTRRDIDKWQALLEEKKNQAINDVCAICAVACAIRRHKELKDARITWTSLSYTDGSGAKKIVKVSGISKYISDIDARRHVEPFKFTVELGA